MADIKLVGAVAIKVRPDARGFRGDTQKKISKELAGVEATVKVKVKGDTTELATDVEKAKKVAEAKSLNLKVGLDHDSVRRAQQQLDRAIKGMAATEINVKLDDEGIKQAQAQIDEMKSKAEVEMTIVRDEKGFKEVLAKIEEIRRQKLEKEITFKTDEESLDREQAKYEKKLAKLTQNQKITFSYNVNRTSIASAIAEVDRELEKVRAIEVETTLNEKGLQKARKRLEDALAKTPVELKVNYEDQESLKATRDRLKQMLTELNSKTLSVAFNEEALRAELQRIDSMIKSEVEDKDRKVPLQVHTNGLELVARQLQFASRARRVPFHVVVDQKSMIVAEGILRSLAGVNTLQAAGRGLESIITKFDTISLKAAGWGSAIGGIADSLIYLVTAAFAVGDGMAEVVGLLATAPAFLSAIAAGAVVTTMAFDNMKKAFNGDAKALAALAPAAREAVRVLDNTWTAMQRPVQQAFWEKAGVSLQGFVDKVIPQFTEGLQGAARGAGLAFDNVVKSFTTLAVSGDLKKMFANLDVLFERVGTAAGPLVDAFNILGLRGSEFFPRFGQWLVDISTKFRDWIAEASRTGDITAWIEDGVNSLKDMWFAAGAIIDQFKAISRATGLIGSNGLDDFRRNMEHIAKVMLAEPFQSRMGTIFAGARAGASELNDGIKDLGRSFGEAASWTGLLLTLLGRFGGDVLSGIATTFSNFKFQSGTLDALRGMSDMVNTMNPAFDRLGDVLGNIGHISSDVFRGLGPVFNTLLAILDDAVDRIAENLGRFAPALLTLTNNMLGFSRLIILPLVDGLNALLGVLNGLPTPLRDATIAFGLFLLLRNQFGAFAGSLGKMWTNLTTSSVAGAGAAKTAAAGIGTAVDGVNRKLVIMADGSVRQMTRFGTFVQTGMATARTHIANFQPNTIVGKLTQAASGVASVVGRINGALALIGGVPGLLLGAIGVAVSVIGGNAAEASAHVDALRGSLDKVTGSGTAETLQLIASKITNINQAGDAWANFWRGVVRGAEAGNETLEKLGINVGTAARAISGSQKDFDKFIGSINALQQVDRNQLSSFLDSGQLPKSAGSLEEAWNNSLSGGGPAVSPETINNLKAAAGAIKDLGLNINDLPSPESLAVLSEEAQKQRDAWQAAQLQQKIYADTLGVTAEKAAQVSAVVATLTDHTADAAGQVDAMRRALDLLNGGAMSQNEAAIARLDGLDVAVENAKRIAESVKASAEVLVGADGMISTASKAGRDLTKIMSEQASNIQATAKATYNAAILDGKTAAEATAAAKAVVASGQTDLDAIAGAAGVSVETLKAHWDTFFGKDWQLTAQFTGRVDLFLAAKAEAEAHGVEFSGEKFEAWLLADPSRVKTRGTDIATQWAQDYANGFYEAQLKAINPAALQTILEATGQAENYANGDYEAVMKALNSTNPGVAAALASIRGVTNGDYAAAIKAFMDAWSAANTKAQLDALAYTRTAMFQAIWDRASLPDLNGAASGSGRPGVANGGLFRTVQRMSDLFSGQYQAKFFANGGIEQHRASIFRPSSVLRFFAERETGGEAYIPLAVSKRPRSLNILSEVARKFGYELTQAKAYASGSAGGHTVPTRTTQTSVTVGTINTVDPESAVKKLQAMQRDALAVAGIH